MALKETKKDRERRLKKAEEQEQEATDAPTDGPTDDEPEEPLLYDAEGVLRPGTSAATAAAAASGASAAASNNAVASAKVGAIPTFFSSDSESDGVAQEKGSYRTGTTGTIAAKRASTRSSRWCSKAPKKKANKSKKVRRRHRKESSSSSSSGRDDRRRSRGRSSSTSASSSSSSSGDSDWEEFYTNDTVAGKGADDLGGPAPIECGGQGPSKANRRGDTGK
jgi:hypothetical protein